MPGLYPAKLHIKHAGACRCVLVDNAGNAGSHALFGISTGPSLYTMKWNSCCCCSPVVTIVDRPKYVKIPVLPYFFKPSLSLLLLRPREPHIPPKPAHWSRFDWIKASADQVVAVC